MKEPEEETGKIAELPLLSVEQAAEFGNIRDVQGLIDAFASNARGVKALKAFHKRLLNDFMPYKLTETISLDLLWFFINAKSS